MLVKNIVPAVVFGVIALAIVALWVLGNNPDESRVHKLVCVNNVKQQVIGLVIYSADNDDAFPRADNWFDVTLNSLQKVRGSPKAAMEDSEFHHHGVLPDRDFGYAFLDKASGIKGENIPTDSQFVLIFDSTLLGRNAHSGLDTLPHPGRHLGFNAEAFADGHAKAIEMR